MNRILLPTDFRLFPRKFLSRSSCADRTGEVKFPFALGHTYCDFPHILLSSTSLRSHLLASSKLLKFKMKLLCNSPLPVVLGFFVYTNASVLMVNDPDTSTAAFDQSLVPSKASNFPNPIVEATCFPTTIFPQEPLLDDCLQAANMYKQDSYYSRSIAYEKNPIPGLIARKVPVYFRHMTCGIVVDAGPDADADIFTLESGWSMLSQIITKCIIEAKPDFKMGGCAPIGSLRGFYLAVGTRPIDNPARNETYPTWGAETRDAPTQYCGRLAQISSETS